MLKHADVWRAIDRLAREYGYSASGLARRAGLDPTTFNKSKRVTREGKLRWPSTESLAKILAATGASLGELVSYAGDDEGGVHRNLPLLAMTQAGGVDHFDDAGHPTGPGWDEIPFPALGDPNAYALEVGGNAMAPVYRDGDILVVSPKASIRRGDRVVVKTKAGEVMVMELRRRSARNIELQSFGAAAGERTLVIEDVDWIARIVWASQ
jgi:phage repressor protein C with HTH and peptisase S24 domain